MMNEIMEAQVAALVNIERAKAGLPPLTVSSELSAVARVKSQDMLMNRQLSHVSPTYGSFGDILAFYGIRFRFAGENIAAGQQTPEAVMNAWMNSPGHRNNILNPNFSEIGVGFATNEMNNTYWTQMFIG